MAKDKDKKKKKAPKEKKSLRKKLYPPDISALPTAAVADLPRAAKAAVKSQFSADPRGLLRATELTGLLGLDCDSTPGWDGGRKDAEKMLAKQGAALSELQERLYAAGKGGATRSVLVVVQGIDTAGKGGIARHVMGQVDPQGVHLHAFKVPTPEEASHEFLWRIRKELPKPGMIGMFDRSHYEDMLVPLMKNEMDDAFFEARAEEIRQFEADVLASGTRIIKLALVISHLEQGLRLKERLDRPDKYWKFSPHDIDVRKQWDLHQQAFDRVIRATSTEVAPWYVVPANKKWYSRLVASEILLRTLVEMNPQWPPADFDVDQQRELLIATFTPEERKILEESGELPRGAE